MSDERLRKLELEWKESGGAEDGAAFLRELKRSGDHVAWLSAAKGMGIVHDYGEALLHPAPLRTISLEDAIAIVDNPSTKRTRPPAARGDELVAFRWVRRLFSGGS